MTSLLKYNLHQMVDYASKENVISACNKREDVCRFMLHSFMDYMTDHGLFDSSFEVLMDWSQTLGVHVDDKRGWKVSKQENPKRNLLLNSSSSSESQLSGSRRPPKLSLKKRVIRKLFEPRSGGTVTPTHSKSVTPVEDESDHTDRERTRY